MNLSLLSWLNILYSTEGADSTNPKPYSLFKRSETISACSKPRNPHWNPLPKLSFDSGLNCREASVSFNFSKPTFNNSKSLASYGKMLKNTFGWGSLYPGNGSTAWYLVSGIWYLVIVSPTLTFPDSLMPVAM